MENAINITSFIVLILSASLLFITYRTRKKYIRQIRFRDDLLKRKDTEYNELRLLAAGVTHEINNAVTIVIGRTHQVLKKSGDTVNTPALESIQKASDRIVTSVKGLRQFIYPDKTEVEEFIELTALMDQVTKLAGQRLKNHGIEMKLVGLDHKVVRGRKTQLEQLIINLLNQSIERLGEQQDKWVQIVAADEAGRVCIYFMDSSGEVGDKISHKQFSEILERSHGHLKVNQNNLILELEKPDPLRFHY